MSLEIVFGIIAGLELVGIIWFISRNDYWKKQANTGHNQIRKDIELLNETNSENSRLVKELEGTTKRLQDARAELKKVSGEKAKKKR